MAMSQRSLRSPWPRARDGVNCEYIHGGVCNIGDFLPERERGKGKSRRFSFLAFFVFLVIVLSVHYYYYCYYYKYREV